jgi:hypothetical protein
MHFALARAYTRAGRKEEANRERDLFKKLQERHNQLRDLQQSGNAPNKPSDKPDPK